jgi:hypothetical protein
MVFVLLKTFLRHLSGQSLGNLAIYAGLKELGYFYLYRAV